MRHTEKGDFVIEVDIPAGPETVFRFYAEPERKRHWILGAAGITTEKFETDLRTGGVEITCFRIGDGPLITTEAHFHEVALEAEIVSTYRMLVDGALLSLSSCVLKLIPTREGTRLIHRESVTLYSSSETIERRRDLMTYAYHALGQLAHALEEQEATTNA